MRSKSNSERITYSPSGRVIFRVRIIFLFVVLTSVCFSARSQFTVTGQLPASVRWSQINTPFFKVVFPSGFEPEAQRTARLLDFVYDKVPSSLGHTPSVPVPVILNNRSVYANGLTVWAPKRMEMFTRPSQSKYAQDWMEQLVLHEYRHVAQMDQLDAGWLKVGKWLFGEQMIGVSGIFLPSWFLEGDATGLETAASYAGRGRTPSFWMDLKASLLTGEVPLSYDGIRYGSYRRYYPDVYTAGYWMTSSLRQRYGEEIFKKILSRLPRKIYEIDPFSAGMKKFTGLTSRNFYRCWYDSLQRVWSQEDLRRSSDSFLVRKVNLRQSPIYTSYRNPQWLNDTTLLAEKTGMDQTREFVTVEADGSEEIIFRPGQITEGKISLSCGILAWAQQIPDPRWSKQSFSGLRFLDLRTGTLRKGQPKASLYSPAISPDGSFVAAVEADTQNQYSLVIFSGDSVVYRISFPVPYTVQFPSWSRDGGSLLCTVDGPLGRTIEKVTVSTGERERLSGPSFLNVQHPVDQGEYIFFTGDFGSTPDIYALRVSDRSVYQVTHSRFGASFPQISPSGARLAYSEYTASGYDLAVTDLDPSRWNLADFSRDFTLFPATLLSDQENFLLPRTRDMDSSYQVRPYRKAGGFFRPHSWLPFYYKDLTELSLSDPEISPGAMLLSQSLLGDMVMTLGYAWERGHAFHGEISYMGLYPKLDLELDYGGEAPVLWSGIASSVVPERTFFQARFRAFLPLQFLDGNWQKILTPYAEMTVNNTRIYQNGQTDPVSGVSYWSGGINFSLYTIPSLRDIRPQWAFTVKAKYMGSPLEADFLGELYLGQLSVAVPGFLNHHSFQASAGYQYQKSKRYYYETQMAFPRGYSKGFAPEFWKFSLDYAFPLAYPDWSIPGLTYLKRVRAALFYEAGGISLPGFNTNLHSFKGLSSAGAEIFFDLHSLGWRSPFSLGCRPSYRFLDRQWGYEFMFSADLSVF